MVSNRPHSSPCVSNLGSSPAGEMEHYYGVK